MLRENYANEGIIREYRNGNITIKFDLTCEIREKSSDIEIAAWLLDSLDTYIIGDQFCLSNYDMGCMLYNLHSDYVYILSFSELDKAYNTGNVLRLYARRPDANDRETIAAYFED